MDVQIDQGRFLSALTLAQTVADRRSTMPILANVLLRATEDGLVCCATDMMTSVTEKLDATVEATGTLSIGVRHLHGVVRTLDDEPIRIKALDNNWAQILASRSEFKLMGSPGSDFPELPDPGSIDFVPVPSHLLTDLIQKTLFSVSTDEARVNLNGALMESDGKQATVVSTDGHRLTKFTMPFAGPNLDARGGSIILPRKGMIEIRKVLDRVSGDVEMGVGDQHLFVRSESLTLSVKLNAVTFPPYSQVIPKEYTRKAIMVRTELVGALKRAEVMAPEKTATVRLELEEGNLKITADNPDLGVAHQELPVEYAGEGLTAGFNARYLIDALEAVDTEKVGLEFQGELDPCVMRPVDGPDFLAVVMPMRI